MSYKAYLNGTKFFDTASIKNNLGLISAVIQYTAGSAGEFSFTVPNSNICYSRFHPNNSNYIGDYIEVYKNTTRIFSCRVTNTSLNFDLTIDVVCEGILAVLNDSLLAPVNFGYDSENNTGLNYSNISDIFRYILTAHNSMMPDEKKFYVDTISTGTKSDYYIGADQLNFTSPETALGMIESVVDLTKGYISARRTANDNLCFSWIANSDVPTESQSIELGKNLIDLTYSKDMTDFVTCVFAYGATITTEVNGTNVDVVTTIDPSDPQTASLMASYPDYKYGVSNAGNVYIYKESAVQKYGKIYTMKTFNYRKTSRLLYASTVSYLSNAASPFQNVEASAVDLANAGYNVDKIDVGHRVNITSPPHSLTNFSLICSGKTLNLLNPSSDELTFNTYIKKKSRLIASNLYS